MTTMDTSAMQRIIRREFGVNISRKQAEALEINRRIVAIRATLDRLRGNIVANYYVSNATAIVHSRDEFEPRSSSRLRKRHAEKGETIVATAPIRRRADAESTQSEAKRSKVSQEQKIEPNRPKEVGSKLYVRKRVIVGNTSKFISPEERAVGDESTHKWMVYVRGTAEEPSVRDFVNRVVFFLHPSYKPNDLVTVSQDPFHLTRRGWGEFPVRVQLHLRDGKTVDVIHNLKLDKTFSGLQTRGAETVVDITIDSLTFSIDQSAHSPTIVQQQSSIRLIENNKDDDVEEEKDDKKRSRVYVPLDVQRSSSRVLFDHCYVSGNVVSLTPFIPCGEKESERGFDVGINSRGSSLLLPRQNRDSGTMIIPVAEPFASPELCLKACIHAFPLIHNGDPLKCQPYAAQSLSEYESWHVGKRRASEWNRAKVLRQVVSNAFRHRPQEKLPSIRRILRWCRTNGHTPNTEASDSSHGLLVCTVCGYQLCRDEVKYNGMHEDCASRWIMRNAVRVSSHSTVDEALRINLSQSALTRLRGDDSYPVVDVVGEKKRVLASFTDQRSLASVESLSPLNRWIYTSLKEIGIFIDSGVEEVILTACRCFIEDVLTSSIEQACLSNREQRTPHLITVAHIYEALIKNPRLTLLTNMGLGTEL